jgi:hypothetical protein
MRTKWSASCALALAVTLAAGMLVANTVVAAADTSATITLNCVAHAPVIGDQNVTQAITISTAAPASVLPGANLSTVTTFPVDQIATSQQGGTVSSVKNLSYKIPVPANSTFVSASLAGGFNYGGSATATLQGSATTGFVRYSVPGPIPAGQNFQLPALTLTLAAGSSLGATIQPRLGGTSTSDPGFTTTAVVTSPISADVTTECYPAAPNPAWSTTTIVPPDTSGPSIALTTPADGGQYPLGQTIPASYTCNDGPFGSGVATCAGDVAAGAPIETSTLGLHTFTVNATDNLGNVSEPVVHTYSVVPAGNDNTPPLVTITTPSNGAVYLQGSAVSADYACVDNESGVASCAGTVADGVAIDTATTGAKSFTVAALDNEGNPHDAAVSYRVVGGGVQQNWTSGDVTNRMPVACDTLLHAFHESIPTSSNVAPANAGAGSQFDWSMAIADDTVPSFNNGSNLVYRWKKPTNAHFVSAAFTGPGNHVQGTAIAINGDGTLQLTVASVDDQSFLGIGDDHFNPPPFRAVIQVDGAAGTIVRNQFDYFQITSTLGGTSHCPAGDPTFNGRVNPILTNTTVIDSAPPSIAITSPTQGTMYAPGASVAFTYSCSDDIGATSCAGTQPSGSAIDTSTSGVYQLHVTSSDAAGNTAQSWVTYGVSNPTVSVTDASVVEGPGAMLVFTVSLSNPSARSISVTYGTSDGTAVQPDDYTSTSGVLTFAPGGPSSQAVQVPVVDDQVFRGNRALDLTLGSAINATLGDATATGSIVDDDPPAVSVADTEVTEAPGAQLDFAVTLAADPNFPVTVAYTTSDGTATAPARYATTTGTLTFSPGDALTQHVTVPVVDNATYDEGASPSNRQTMTLTATTTANGAGGVGTGTIVDDEIRPPVLNIGSVTLREGDGYNRAVKLVVTLNRPASQPVTVHYAATPGSASAGSDYIAKSGTLTFKPNIIARPVTINIKGDTSSEPDESFSIKLSAASSNSVIGDDNGEITILDDDSPTASAVEASVSDGSVYEGTSPTNKRTQLAFTVSLNKRPAATVTVKYHTQSVGSDIAGKSGTLTFTPKQVAKVVVVNVVADAAFEPNETFSLIIDNPSPGVTITDGAGIGMIFNDD